MAETQVYSKIILLFSKTIMRLLMHGHSLKDKKVKVLTKGKRDGYRSLILTIMIYVQRYEIN